MTRFVRTFTGSVAAGAISLTGACGWIIGLDEFTDQSPPGPDAGGGGGGACSTPSDCPGGEHGNATCEEGTCGFACAQGFADCDSTVGCETATTEDRNNCGGCGVTCGAFCEASSCNDPIAVATGYRHTCALLSDGSVWCWGANNEGQLGDGTLEDRHLPTRVTLPEPAVEIAAGGIKPQADIAETAHTCAVLANHSMMCWGSNIWSQLGIGAAPGSTLPEAVSLDNVEHVSAGGRHTCALRADATLYCWGNNSSGQIGNGSSQTAVLPANVGGSFARVAAGGHHTCAITTGASLQCWGSDSSGQLGIGAQGDKALPVSVSVGSNVVDVSAGGSHTCARRAVGMYCWGNGFAGQLGLGSFSDQSTPQPLSLPGISLIDLGSAHSSAVANGAAYIWGANYDGQLGDGTAVNSPDPKPLRLANVTSISLGAGHSCALTSAGAAFCWGANNAGQLGDGTTDARGSPTAVAWP